MSNLEKVKKFIPYGTDPEKDKMVRSVNWEDRRKMVKEGYGVDVLINEAAIVRFLKDQELTLLEFADRENIDLQINAHNIDIKSVEYKRMLFDSGLYTTEIYLRNPEMFTSSDNFRNTQDKDVIFNDNEDIRKMAAKQGYKLDVLISDKSSTVRQAVLDYLEKNDLTLKMWAEEYDKELDDFNIKNKPIEYKKAMIDSGLCLAELIDDENENIREAVFDHIKDLDDKKHNKDLQVQKAVAKKGYGLDNLVKDNIPEEFKATVESFISLTFDLPLNTFEEERERKNIYNTCDNLIANRIGIDEFITSERAEPRGMVAEHGIALDVLINDEDYDVRKTVLDYLKTRSITLSQWANYEEKSLDFNKLLNSPYEEVRLEAFRCVYRDSIDNLKNVGFPIDFKDMEDVKDHIFNNPTTCIKALRFLGDESVKSGEKYKEVLSILVSKSEELKRDHTSFPEKFNSFIKNGPYSVFKDFEKVRNGSLDINDPSISRFNTMKLEIQNLKNQISILAKENKSLQKTLEKYVSVEKETDEKEL